VITRYARQKPSYANAAIDIPTTCKTSTGTISTGRAAVSPKFLSLSA
jgi:hypothetical protein